jgi:hypothetical protein
MPDSRKAVGIYERPHPLRSRRIVLSVAIAAGVAILYALWAWLA